MKKRSQLKQKIAIVGIFFILFTTILLAQSNAFSSLQVDIKEMVKAEITQIKNKNTLKVETKSKELNTKNSTTSKSNKKEISALHSFYFTNKSSFVKGFILLEASILAALIVLWRRRNLAFHKKKEKFFKDNIQNIRQEKIITLENFEERKNRNKLLSKKIKHIKEGKSITKLAKKLSISKGELYLAAKIKFLAKS